MKKRFDQGLIGKKIDAAEIARQMVEDDSILPSERMTASQIRSYLSKLCEENKKKTAEPVSRAKRYVEVEENECPMDPDYDVFADEEIENIEDVGLDQFDLLRDYVKEFKKDIFELDSKSPLP